MASSLEWGTHEELILACAVTRHGTNSWDSIAIELQTRTTNLPSVTSQSCIEKFSELNRRFTEDMILMVNELRRIRVEELRRDLSNCDASIVSLELKVKRMKEETKETDLIKDETHQPATVAGDERDDRSFNESNSTSQQKANKLPDEKLEPKSETETETEQDPIRSGWFYNDNDDSKKQSEKKINNNNNSDVQSSASLSLRRMKTMSSSCDEPEDGAGLEPMAGLLEIIRRDRLVSMFERRLPSQECDRYKKLIKQPINLETVASRLKKGAYANSTRRFFRDLLLLVNNVIVFHGRSSPEHAAAGELRHVVLREMRARIPKPKPRPKPDYQEPEATFSNPDPEPAPVPTTSATMIPCGSRGSIKAGSGSTSPRGNQGEGLEEEAKRVGSSSFVEVVRKGRRNARSKVEIKRESRCVAGMASLAIDRRGNSVSKRQGVARFLKRMKQNSPTEFEATQINDRSSLEEAAGDKIVQRTKKKSSDKPDATKKMGFRGRAGAVAAAGAGGASTRKETRWGKRIGRPPKIQETHFLDSRAAAATTKRRRDAGETPARRPRGNKRSRR